MLFSLRPSLRVIKCHIYNLLLIEICSGHGTLKISVCEFFQPNSAIRSGDSG
uniref:Uncharacterized protein n=1 Tax=Rhizophora mucronata TaxID=61149 RepID=A0A2P2JAI6_RHIMU